MTITQISAAQVGNGVQVFGLGDDNKVYVWRTGAWTILAGAR